MKFNLRIAVFALILSFVAVQAQAQWNSDFYHGAVQPNAQRPMNPGQTRAQTKSANVAPRAVATGQTRAARYGALIVAAERYVNLPSLSGCANDARAFKTWLEEKANAKADNIVALCDYDDVADVPPTAVNIREALKKAATLDCELLFAHFAGHGVGFGDRSFFCPIDVQSLSDLDTVESADVLDVAAEKGLVPTSEILETLKSAKAKHVVVILDACRDAQDESRGFLNEFHELKNRLDRGNGKTLSVITSCSFNEKAREIVVDGEARGLFMNNFLNGLTDGRADRVMCYDGNVRLIEAYNYAYSQTSSYARASSSARSAGNAVNSQTPEIFMSNADAQPTLIAYSLDYNLKGDVDDLRLLLRAGLFCSQFKGDYPRFDQASVNLGVRALTTYLNCVPSDEKALEARAGVYRSEKKYAEALQDFNKVGQKLQLYAKTKGTANGEGWKQGELLTVSNVRNDKDGVKLVVTEVNNAPLKQRIIVKTDVVEWSGDRAQNVTTASRFNASQGRPVGANASTSYSSLSPGGGGGRISGTSVSSSPAVRF